MAEFKGFQKKAMKLRRVFSGLGEMRQKAAITAECLEKDNPNPSRKASAI